MSRNTTHIRAKNDWYIEEPWCVHLLVAAEKFASKCRFYDPCCGLGTIPQVMRAHGYSVRGSDLVDRGGSDRHGPAYDVTGPTWLEQTEPDEIIVTNPPFNIADQVVRQFLASKSQQIFVLLPSGWGHAAGQDEDRSRHSWLQSIPLSHEWKIGPRPSMPPGSAILKGVRPKDGKTDFSWWKVDKKHKGPPTFGWLTRRDKAGQ